MKKTEVGDKRVLSHGYVVDHDAQKAKHELIQSKTDVFLAKGGSIKEIENGVMVGDVKGHTALTINHEKVADGFKTK